MRPYAIKNQSRAYNFALNDARAVSLWPKIAPRNSTSTGEVCQESGGAGVDRQRVMKLFLPAWTGLESVGWREVKYPEMNGSPPLLLC